MLKPAACMLTLLAFLPHALAEPPTSAPAKTWRVAENNPILNIYVGEKSADGTELVLELGSMHFYSNQQLYGCVFVNGHIAHIKEYNNRDSYVRVIANTPPNDEELLVYCGVIKAPEKLDPHDHAALWQTFRDSAHKPFRAKLADLPKWYVVNPIVAKRMAASQPAPKKNDNTSAYPRLQPEERPAKAKEALDPLTGDKARFQAVWGLAISGYSPESAAALATIAANAEHEVTLREYAAMGLGNFTSQIPDAERKATLDRLCNALETEKENLPPGVLRIILQWGGEKQIRQALGPKLRGHHLELEMLHNSSTREDAITRLIELYRAAPAVTTADGWTQRWRIGAALIAHRDKRGIDILIECLTVTDPWPAPDDSPAAKENRLASFRQSLHNTYTRLASLFDEDFGYTGGTWSPQLSDAIPKLVAWWKLHRDEWSFEVAQSTELPKLEKGRALTKRQARVLAAKHANDALAQNNLTTLDGKPIKKATITPEWFNDVTLTNGRWVLQINQPRGLEARIEFDPDGLNQTITLTHAHR